MKYPLLLKINRPPSWFSLWKCPCTPIAISKLLGYPNFPIKVFGNKFKAFICKINDFYLTFCKFFPGNLILIKICWAIWWLFFFLTNIMTFIFFTVIFPIFAITNSKALRAHSTQTSLVQVLMQAHRLP